jgi:hypothetical protein
MSASRWMGHLRIHTPESERTERHSSGLFWISTPTLVLTSDPTGSNIVAAVIAIV